MNAGEFLRRARQARKLDQAALARRAATTQPYVSRIERGRVSPSIETLSRLFRAMGLKLTIESEPLSVGNAEIDRLQQDFRAFTPAERVADAMELSEFLTEVAESGAASTGSTT